MSVRDTKLYDLLEIPPNATQAQATKAFRKMAMKYHPDKNPSPEAHEKFKEINTAYEILSDPEKRQKYDRYGMKAFEEGGDDGRGGMHGDFFSSFFSGGFQQRQKRTKDIVQPLSVTLEDLYNGTTKKHSYTRQSTCAGCDGTGSSDKQQHICSACKGTGAREVLQHIGAGMAFRQTVPCRQCDGGYIVPPHLVCGKCHGQKIMEEIRQVNVDISKGSADGQKLVFRNESHKVPGYQSGDVIFVLQTEKHPVFTREGSTLKITKEVSLVDALTGFSFQIQHLDNRILHLKLPENTIIQPGQEMEVPQEGMPLHARPYENGNLVVMFQIVFPNQLDQNQKDALLRCLPDHLTPPQVPPNAETVFLSVRDSDSIDEDDQKEAYDSDDDNRPRGGVQCAQQ